MEKPLVGIVMGSTSDEAVLEGTRKMLRKFKIPFEERILSAHRSPEKVREYARTAEERGIEVIIAAAGKAAHLPGVIASFTTLPIIGVPIKTSDLSGLDSLLSMVQMPRGVPVATVAINGAENAAILAAQILATSYAEIKESLRAFKKELAE
jgi:5-(carboxyamino)imidazole ribonucleotide mutase